MKYTFNIPQFITNMLPTILRKPIQTDWLTALLGGIVGVPASGDQPAQGLFNEFVAFRDQVNDQISINSQTLLLQTILNEKMGTANANVIQLVTNSIFSNYYFEFEPSDTEYDHWDLRPEDGKPDYWQFRPETATNNIYNLTVKFPASVANYPPLSSDDTTKLAKLDSLLRQYLFAGISYNKMNYV